MQHKHDNLAAAIDFIEKVGEAYLFPIIGYGGKGPIIPVKWSMDNSTSPDTIEQYAEDYPGCAFGIHLGKSGLVVVDVDDKGGEKQDGTKTMEQLRVEGFELPMDTLRVKTPSGKGYHLYYRGQCKNNNDGAIGESIDIKGGVGYVPAPGQYVHGKGMYAVEGRYKHPRNVPEWIPDKVGEYDAERVARRKERRKEQEAKYQVEPDKENNLVNAIEFLSKGAETAYEGCRDTVSYKVACKMHDYGVSMEKAEELMYKFWVPRCDMGDWTLENVQAKIESAYQRASGAFGNDDLSVFFKDVTKSEGWEEQPESEKRVRVPYLEKLKNVIHSARDIAPAAIPRREWLVHGRFIQGFVTLTISPGGIGKSTMSILEALAVATDRGDDLIHRKTYGQEPVWIYNLEDPQEELDRRIAAAALRHGIDLDDLPHFYSSSGLSLGLTICREGRSGIEINYRALQACKDFIVENGIKLWVIDPLVKAHLVNENDNGAMDRLMTELSKIAMETKCSIHLVHHTRKKNNDTGNGDADTARGASSVVSAARVAHTLNGMGAKEAAKYGLGDEKNWYLRVDDAKANLTAPADKADWFKRVSVKLPNGDYVGVLEFVDLSEHIKNVPFNTQVIDAVIALMPRGQYPVIEMAKLLHASGEFINEKEGSPMSVNGIRDKIKDVFHNIVEQGGKTIQYATGRRLRTGYRKDVKDWLDCEYDKFLEEGIASGRVEASALNKDVKGTEKP